MSPMSNVTDCHNLVAKKNKKKRLFINHFRIVRNLSGNELTRRDQTVVNLSFEIVFPVKGKGRKIRRNKVRHKDALFLIKSSDIYLFIYFASPGSYVYKNIEDNYKTRRGHHNSKNQLLWAQIN